MTPTLEKPEEMQPLLDWFAQTAENPRAQLEAALARGEKAVGCLPYFAPEELIHAMGMRPFGLWGTGGLSCSLSAGYFPPFYCSLARTSLELALRGSLRGLCAVTGTLLCDTLRPRSQNWAAALPGLPFLPLACPQQRQEVYALTYFRSQLEGLARRLEGLGGRPLDPQALQNSLEVYNASRAARRRFVALAGRRGGLVSPLARCQVLKAALFAPVEEYLTRLTRLNRQLEALPDQPPKLPLTVSGILCDSPALLRAFEGAGFTIAADDLAQESRSFRVDAPQDEDPLLALAMRFCAQNADPLLYDPDPALRPRHLVRLVRESGSRGLVLVLQQFCDVEEMEWPALKAELDRQGIPSLVIGADQEMTDFGQAATLLEAFAERLG